MVTWHCGLCALRGTLVKMRSIEELRDHIREHILMYGGPDEVEKSKEELQKFHRLLRFFKDI